MSLTKTLESAIASLPTATSLSNHLTILSTSAGTLKKSFQSYPVPQTPMCNDADLATPGWMRTTTSTANLPIKGLGGFLLTLQYDVIARIQFFYAWNPAIYVRRHTSGTSNDRWEPWMKVTMTAIS